MSGTIKVLLIEDSADDEFLTLYELKKSGFNVISRRVQSRVQMEKALESEPWDIVICDYNLPGFSGMEALQIFQEKNIDIPFIVLSGIIGEDVAVEMMRQGANDYIMKNNLRKLSPAITRELREVQTRMAKKKAEDQIKRLNHVYKVLSGINQAILRIQDPQILLNEVSAIAITEGQFTYVYVCKKEESKLTVVTDLVNDHSEIDLSLLTIEYEAVRTGQPIFRNNGENLAAGSVGVLPLIVAGDVWGTISFYTEEKNIFTFEETQLLIELSTDLSLALETKTAQVNRPTSELLINKLPGFVFKLVFKKEGSYFSYVSDQIKDFINLSPEALLNNSELFFNGLTNQSKIAFHRAINKSVETGSFLSEKLELETMLGKKKLLLLQAIPQMLNTNTVELVGLGISLSDNIFFT